MVLLSELQNKNFRVDGCANAAKKSNGPMAVNEKQCRSRDPKLWRTCHKIPGILDRSGLSRIGDIFGSIADAFDV